MPNNRKTRACADRSIAPCEGDEFGWCQDHCAPFRGLNLRHARRSRPVSPLRKSMQEIVDDAPISCNSLDSRWLSSLFLNSQEAVLVR